MTDDPRTLNEISDDDRALALYWASIDPDVPMPTLPQVPTARQAEELRCEHERIAALKIQNSHAHGPLAWPSARATQSAGPMC